MNNPYKRMYVLSEEEYNRLKLQQQQQKQEGEVIQTNQNEEPPSSSQFSTTATTIGVQTLPINYGCPICGKSYKQKRDLKRHVKLAHSVVPPKKAIIPHSAIEKPLTSKVIIEENKSKPKNKNKNIKRKDIAPQVFDKVKKWMTIRCNND
jgi:hypothetical protein